MKIAISGTTGLIGGALEKRFSAAGWQVIPLQRSDFEKGAPFLASKMEGSGSVIHLAGAPILKRWTTRYKEEIKNSRLSTTKLMSEAIALMSQKPASFLCASAVGIYKPNHLSTEEQPVPGSDFLAKVCAQWETMARAASPFTRVVHLRFGVVLAGSGGALAAMLPLFRMGLGGKIASGKQPFPWIHLDDLASAVEFIVSNRQISGAVNMVAPGRITNADFTKVLAGVLKRPAFIPVPAFALRLAYGEGAATLFNAPDVVPAKLSSSGFRFCFPEIGDALVDLL